MMIDKGRLPGRALIDSGVLMRFLEPDNPLFLRDPRAEVCNAFCEAMLECAKTLLIRLAPFVSVMRGAGGDYRYRI